MAMRDDLHGATGLVLLLLVCGCSPSSRTGNTGGAGNASGSGGGANVSTGGSAAGSGGGGTVAGPQDCSGIRTNADGVLTNVPNASFINEGSDVVLKTARIIMLHNTEFSTVLWWGEVQNEGSHTQCIPLVDALFDGVDVAMVGDAPPYLTYGSLSDECMPPGKRGIVMGIKTEVPATLLDSLSTVRYNVDTMGIDDAVAHPSAPTISGLALDTSQTIPVITGTARAVATITNVELSVYPLDGCGLIVSKFTDFHLDDWLQGTAFDFRATPQVADALEGEVYGTDGMVWTGFIDDAYDMMWIEPSFATPEQQRFAAQWSRLRLSLAHGGYRIQQRPLQ